MIDYVKIILGMLPQKYRRKLLYITIAYAVITFIFLSVAFLAMLKYLMQ